MPDPLVRGVLGGLLDGLRGPNKELEALQLELLKIMKMLIYCRCKEKLVDKVFLEFVASKRIFNSY